MQHRGRAAPQRRVEQQNQSGLPPVVVLRPANRVFPQPAALDGLVAKISACSTVEERRFSAA
ncbi:MAG TPA: hypothetical protein VGG04_02865 [Candidatus Sulfotelmatobacter sp.]